MQSVALYKLNPAIAIKFCYWTNPVEGVYWGKLLSPADQTKSPDDTVESKKMYLNGLSKTDTDMVLTVFLYS